MNKHNDTTTSDIIFKFNSFKISMSSEKNYYLKLWVLFGFWSRMLYSDSDASQPVFFLFRYNNRNYVCKKGWKHSFLFIHFKSTCIIIIFRSIPRFPNEHDRRHIHRRNNTNIQQLFVYSVVFLFSAPRTGRSFEMQVQKYIELFSLLNGFFSLKTHMRCLHNQFWGHHTQHNISQLSIYSRVLLSFSRNCFRCCQCSLMLFGKICSLYCDVTWSSISKWSCQIQMHSLTMPKKHMHTHTYIPNEWSPCIHWTYALCEIF